eukprot:scaffold317764_cov19-Tisochrysis_lutea.AAC.2
MDPSTAGQDCSSEPLQDGALGTCGATRCWCLEPFSLVLVVSTVLECKLAFFASCSSTHKHGRKGWMLALFALIPGMVVCAVPQSPDINFTFGAASLVLKQRQATCLAFLSHLLPRY